MSWFDLPGNAAFPLVLTGFLNLYAGIGAVLTMHITVKQVLILALMMSFSHNLIVESSVAARLDVKVWVILSTRIGLSILSGLVIAHFWSGGQAIAHYGLIPSTTEDPTTWLAILVTGLQKAFFGILQLAMIVIPLMLGIQILKDLSWLDTITKWLSPLTKVLGMEQKSAMTLAAGLLIGLAYGAGVMIQAVKDDGVKKKDLYLALIFLVSRHAIIEDTLIFVPMGIYVLPLLISRLAVAVCLTALVGIFLNKREKEKAIQVQEGSVTFD